jgi:hypothetical protein
MIEVDAPSFVASWFARRRLGSVAGLKAVLVLPNEKSGLNNAGVKAETRTHLASIAVWGSGMVEIIFFDKALMSEERVLDIEANSIDELDSLLTANIADLIELGQEP